MNMHLVKPDPEDLYVAQYDTKPNFQSFRYSDLKMFLPHVQGFLFVRIAAVLGALAVVLAAYGAHVLDPQAAIPEEQKNIFSTGNKFHFLHSLALFAVPMARKPYLTGLLLITGMFLFCGSCYITGVTGNQEVAVFTPLGGILMALGWLSMAL